MEETLYERVTFKLNNSRLGMSSACFYPDETLEAVKHCIDLGFENIEIFINTFSELEKPYLDKISRCCLESGTRVVAIHPFTSGFEYLFFFSAYKKRAKEAAELYRKYFHAAAYLGADYSILHGDALKAPFFGLDNYCEVLEMLSQTAKEEGVMLIHENVSTARAGNPEFMKALREKIGKGKLKYAFDIKQAARGGYSPFDMLEAMGDDIVHVHINDWLDGECKLAYAGGLDLDGIISRLEAGGYSGKYIVEVYKKNFSRDDEISVCKKKIEEKLLSIKAN